MARADGTLVKGSKLKGSKKGKKKGASEGVVKKVKRSKVDSKPLKAKGKKKAKKEGGERRTPSSPFAPLAGLRIQPTQMLLLAKTQGGTSGKFLGDLPQIAVAGVTDKLLEKLAGECVDLVLQRGEGGRITDDDVMAVLRSNPLFRKIVHAGGGLMANASVEVGDPDELTRVFRHIYQKKPPKSVLAGRKAVQEAPQEPQKKRTGPLHTKQG